MDTRRLLALSGVAFVVIALVAIIGLGGDTPSNDASAAEVAGFYSDHSTRNAIAAFVLAASIPFLVFFAVALANALWPGGESRPVWPYVLIGGAALTGASLLAAAWIHFALADGGDNKVDPAGLQALNVLDAGSWVAFNGAFGVMMLGAAGCFLTRAGGHVWLGWVALVAGIALFIPFADFFALILTLIWIIVVSIMLARGAWGRSDGEALPAT